MAISEACSNRPSRMEYVIHTYSIGLRTRFRGLITREGMIITGEAGVGEFSPFWDYDDAESAPWLRAAHEAAHHGWRSEEHTSELQSRGHLVCRLLLEKKKKNDLRQYPN